MEALPVLVALVVGFVLGLAAAFALRLIQGRTAKDLATELFRESDSERQASVQAVIEQVKANFGSLSLEALSRCTQEFLKLAKEKLESERGVSAKEMDGKKALIDQQLERISKELGKASEKYGEVAGRILELDQTTRTLREALSSSKMRGQWGERMAEDVLRLAGLLEGVNYVTQKTIEGVGTRPDFTFLLPRSLKLNMDVKFSLDNYLRFLDAASEAEREKFRKDFLRDIRERIKEVTTREYINPEQNTLDYVLLFIANEQIYGFLHEQDPAILDEALKKKVVLCSPLTLFAVLAVIRHAVDSFALEQTSKEILGLFGKFHAEWAKYVKALVLLGERIEAVRKQYDDEVAGKRLRGLERPLEKIEKRRVEAGIPIAPDDRSSTEAVSEAPEEAKGEQAA